MEELEAGQRFRRWPGRTIPEYDGALLSLPSMNQHPGHHGERFARHTQRGRRPAAGPAVIRIAIGRAQAEFNGRGAATASNQRRGVVLTLERRIVPPGGGNWACKQ